MARLLGKSENFKSNKNITLQDYSYAESVFNSIKDYFDCDYVITYIDYIHQCYIESATDGMVILTDDMVYNRIPGDVPMYMSGGSTFFIIRKNDDRYVEYWFRCPFFGEKVKEL